MIFIDEIQTLSHKFRIRQGCPVSLLPLSIVLDILTSAIRENNVKKENFKASVFAYNVIVYLENSKGSTKSCFKLTSELTKLT